MSITTTRAPRHGLAAEHDLLGREHVRQRRVGTRDRALGDAVEAVGRPVRAGRDDDEAGAARTHVVRVQAHARSELEIGEPARSRGGASRRSAPRRRGPADAGSSACNPRFVGGVDEPHALEAALGEHDRALQPGGPGADHEHVAVGVGRALEALGMPAAAVLLARRRVLRAAQVASAVGERVAGVAADAGADLVVAALLDLERQERVGDRRRAAPIRSHTPLSITSAITSGSTISPVPTIGLAVASRKRAVHSSW